MDLDTSSLHSTRIRTRTRIGLVLCDSPFDLAQEFGYYFKRYQKGI
jgi:hypothetical protein